MGIKELLEKDFDLSIVNATFYERALTHSSCTKDDPKVLDNERLEFLGDAVLKLVFSNFLFIKYPKEQEGMLTKYRARLISDDLLAQISRDIKLTELIQIGSSLKSVSSLPDSVCGDALEAMIGAIYLDIGYDPVEKFILKAWDKFIEEAIKDAIKKDYKSILQEKVQALDSTHPEYKLLSSSGPSHDMIFRMGVFVKTKLVAEGEGSSKKTAGQNAAKLALEKHYN